LLTRDIVQISPKSIVDDACVSYATLDRLNTQIKPALDDLTSETDFFSHYRLNLFNKRCPFWDDEGGMCGNIGCAVETLDNEEDIPEVWRASELGKLEGPLAKHPGKVAQKQHPEKPLQGKLGENVGESCVVEYDDECDERDYCVPDDERAGSKGDYVSLLRNPERFTGYGGDGAKQVWDAIYRENCFQRSSFPHAASLGSSAPTGPAQLDFKHVLDAAARHQQLVNPDDSAAGLDADGECLEKRVFYRVVSGMHASISAHLCWDFMNQSTGEWQPNPQCYASRLHAHPDRISNLYFNYALVTRAVAKLGRYVKDYTFCMDDETEDAATRAKVLEVTERAAIVPNLFDESLMFVNGEGPSLKEDFRNRFRNVSRLICCTGRARARHGLHDQRQRHAGAARGHPRARAGGGVRLRLRDVRATEHRVRHAFRRDGDDVAEQPGVRAHRHPAGDLLAVRAGGHQHRRWLGRSGDLSECLSFRGHQIVVELRPLGHIDLGRAVRAQSLTSCLVTPAEEDGCRFTRSARQCEQLCRGLAYCSVDVVDQHEDLAHIYSP
jgi:hypothetical protein